MAALPCSANRRYCILQHYSADSFLFSHSPPLSFRPKRGAGRRAKRRNLSHCTFAFAIDIGSRVPIGLFHIPRRFLDCARLHPCSARNDRVGTLQVELFIKQIIPSGIYRIYQLFFFCTRPTFYLFFAGKGFAYITMRFGIYKYMYIISVCKCLFVFPLLMLEYSTRNIIGYPHIQHRMHFITQNVNIIRFSHIFNLFCRLACANRTFSHTREISRLRTGLPRATLEMTYCGVSPRPCYAQATGSIKILSAVEKFNAAFAAGYARSNDLQVNFSTARGFNRA